LKRKNHYDVLNVHRNADKRVIKKQYYRLSKQYHPDLNPNNTDAHAKFLEVNEAYAVLGNEASRRRYD
ncbi:DnaJ domain-containing protein, partial [Zychaea mexicana]|uniref:DnaJ domain-containing protein n=1 Tax=Zychaea mexicana TaxID=64656 RepID=UPI0022FDE447